MILEYEKQKEYFWKAQDIINAFVQGIISHEEATIFCKKRTEAWTTTELIEFAVEDIISDDEFRGIVGLVPHDDIPF